MSSKAGQLYIGWLQPQPWSPHPHILEVPSFTQSSQLSGHEELGVPSALGEPAYGIPTGGWPELSQQKPQLSMIFWLGHSGCKSSAQWIALPQALDGAFDEKSSAKSDSASSLAIKMMFEW